MRLTAAGKSRILLQVLMRERGQDAGFGSFQHQEP